jgi:hypothetical protein
MGGGVTCEPQINVGTVRLRARSPQGRIFVMIASGAGRRVCAEGRFRLLQQQHLVNPVLYIEQLLESTELKTSFAATTVLQCMVTVSSTSKA